MPDLSQVVRPNQTPNVRPISGPAVAAGPDETLATITWGKSGDDIFNQQGLHYGGTIDDKQTDKVESKRTYDVIRIENEDDPDQYVDTEVMTNYTARNMIDPTRTQIAPERTKIQFNGTGDYPPNVKVIARGLTRTNSAGS